VSFDPETEGKDLKNALDFFQYSLKGISFLPKTKDVYLQMPYEEISKEEYLIKSSKIKPLNMNEASELFSNGKDPSAEKFCDGDTCTF
jgi:ribonucleoside-triphosphate reductase